MVELQDVMKKYSKEYKEKHKLMPHIQKTMNAIGKAELGAHEDVCDNCGHVKISYNSCRNRHCPKCQIIAREKWIYNREVELTGKTQKYGNGADENLQLGLIEDKNPKE